MNIPDAEIINDPLKEMSNLANKYLNLVQWGFVETNRLQLPSPTVVYNSEWCKVKLLWGGWDYSTGYSMEIFYGRLHAIDDAVTMDWKGQECYCWHRIEPALHFLDGTSPRDSAKMFYRSKIMHQFRLSDTGKKLAKMRRQPEWNIRRHAAVWGHYKQELFELFDQRNSELWSRYQTFIKDVYKIMGMIPHIKPPEDQIC